MHTILRRLRRDRHAPVPIDLRPTIAQRIAQLEAERDKMLFGYASAIGELRQLLAAPPVAGADPNALQP